MWDLCSLRLSQWPYRRDGQRRANVRNVLLQTVGRGRRQRKRLVWLIDHTHCLTRREGGGFAARIDAIDHAQDDRLLGLFPAFVGFVTSRHAGPWVERLRSIAEADIRATLSAVPSAWEVEPAQRTALFSLLLRRRDYLLDYWLPALAAACAWPTSLTDPDDHEET
jgi:hypothetical protein